MRAAPIDEGILSVAEPRWQKVAMIIARAAKAGGTGVTDDEAGHRIIASRIRALVQTRRLCKRLAIVIVALLVFVAMCYFGLPLLHFLVIGPLRGALRSNEKLPSVTVETGGTLYCRMSYCDFRFPLPEVARVAQTDPVSGGFDWIKGAVYVTNTTGGTIDLQAYAERLRRHHFNVQPGFTSEANPPWVGSPAQRHHPEGYTIPFAASTRDGGWVAVDVIDHMTKVAFSYFGDY